MYRNLFDQFLQLSFDVKEYIAKHRVEVRKIMVELCNYLFSTEQIVKAVSSVKT
jgi:hypothetical protein